MSGVFGLGVILLLSPAAHAENEEPEEARSVVGRKGLAPKFSLHGFTDATFLTESASPPVGGDETEAGFFLGEFDLYMVSHLGRRLSFLGEVVFEFEDDGETRSDVERVFLKYSQSDLLWASIGRRHTPLGHWNETYHHGFLLQPTVQRPTVLSFEDKGGVLPVHSVGMDVGGRLFRRAWSLDYRAGIYNGRGESTEVVQAFGDANTNKATLLKVSFEREKTDRVKFGVMGHADVIPPDPGVAERDGDIEEKILGFHFVYDRPQIKFLGEYYFIRHENDPTDTTYEHRGYYAIAIWQPWKLKPYVGYDVLDLEQGDPYYVGVLPYQQRSLVGLRFDPQPFLAIKLELRHDDRLEQPETEVNGLAIQVAYTF
jgi:hypothetical protein